MHGTDHNEAAWWCEALDVHVDIDIRNGVSRLPIELPHTLGDFGLLRQACVNVLMNACEAMPLQGRLDVETSLTPDGQAYELSFQDTGPGIPPERLARVFDPFFSTKDGGAGLGLSVVHGIVHKHGGEVVVTSEEGRGTRVVLRLPARGREAAPPGGG